MYVTYGAELSLFNTKGTVVCAYTLSITHQYIKREIKSNQIEVQYLLQGNCSNCCSHQILFRTAEDSIPRHIHNLINDIQCTFTHMHTL